MTTSRRETGVEVATEGSGGYIRGWGGRRRTGVKKATCRYQFLAPITKRDFGRMCYTVVFAPDETAESLRLKEHPRLRIEGKVGGVPFSGAFQPNGGEWYLILAKRLLKEAGLSLDDEVVVEFRVADQNKVEVPGDLLSELRRRPKVWDAWQSMTAGRRRGLSIRVSSAKRPETRERRILEVVDQVVDGPA